MKQTVELTEYIINYKSCQTSKIQLIGRKQLILSESTQANRRESFYKPLFMPHIDKVGKVKGCQLVLKEDN